MRLRSRTLLSALTAVATAVLAAAAPVAGAASTAHVPMAHHTELRLNMNQSGNWAGYSIPSVGAVGAVPRVFSSISATWTVPTVSSAVPGTDQHSSSWIGIGGGCVEPSCTAADSTLIQEGVEHDIDRYGNVTTFTWWELIPAPAVEMGVPVRPGDSVTMSITETLPGVWTFYMHNNTQLKTWTRTLPYTSTHSTAEWIVETPISFDVNGNVAIGPMDSLSTIQFDDATLNGAPAGLDYTQALQLVDPFSGQVVATPSVPDAEADGFNVCTYSTSCSPPTTS